MKSMSFYIRFVLCISEDKIIVIFHYEFEIKDFFKRKMNTVKFSFILDFIMRITDFTNAWIRLRKLERHQSIVSRPLENRKILP